MSRFFLFPVFLSVFLFNSIEFLMGSFNWPPENFFASKFFNCLRFFSLYNYFCKTSFVGKDKIWFLAGLSKNLKNSIQNGNGVFYVSYWILILLLKILHLNRCNFKIDKLQTRLKFSDFFNSCDIPRYQKFKICGVLSFILYLSWDVFSKTYHFVMTFFWIFLFSSAREFHVIFLIKSCMHMFF